MKHFLTIILLLSMAQWAFADSARDCIRRGNRLYHQQKFEKAEVEYRKALDRDAKNPQALYNLGCALLAQQQDSAAIVQFEEAGKQETNKLRRAKAFHNIGWICQSKRMFAEAIDAYKESLRCNPDDEETRYNLALCLRQKQDQNDQQEKNRDNNQPKDPNKEEDRTEEEEQNQDKPVDFDDDSAERLLNAAMQQEKETQDKLNQMRQPPRQDKIKNW